MAPKDRLSRNRLKLYVPKCLFQALSYFSGANDILIYLVLFCSSNILARKTVKKLLVAQLVKKFLMFCGSRKFITLFTKASRWSLWRARRKQVIPHTTFLQFCLTLCCYLYLGLPSGLFSLASATQILSSFSNLPMRATSPAYLIVVHIEECK